MYVLMIANKALDVSYNIIALKWELCYIQIK